MKILIAVFILMFFMGMREFKTETDNPVADYIEKMEIGNEELLMFQVDLNGDKIGEVFLSKKDAINGQMGNMWAVYISQGEKGYELSPDILSINTDTLIHCESVPPDFVKLIYYFRRGHDSLGIFAVELVDKKKLKTKLIAEFTFKDPDYPYSDVIINLLRDNRTVNVIMGTGPKIQEYFIKVK